MDATKATYVVCKWNGGIPPAPIGKFPSEMGPCEELVTLSRGEFDELRAKAYGVRREAIGELTSAAVAKSATRTGYQP